ATRPFTARLAFMCDYGEALLHPTDLFMRCRIRLPKRRSRQVRARSRRTGGVVGVLADGAPDVDCRGDGAAGAFQEKYGEARSPESNRGRDALLSRISATEDTPDHTLKSMVVTRW